MTGYAVLRNGGKFRMAQGIDSVFRASAVRNEARTAAWEQVLEGS